jgi:hypothetical protein
VAEEVIKPPAPPPEPLNAELKPPPPPPPPATIKYSRLNVCTGVTLLDADEAVDVPLALIAVIVNVYAWFVVNVPVTVNGVEVPEVVNATEGLDVTV